MVDQFTNTSALNPRISQTKIDPTAVKNRNLPSNILANTTATLNGPYTIGSGNTLTFTSTIVNTKNAKITVGAAPYFFCIIESPASTANVYPGGTLAGNKYIVVGPMAMPNAAIGGTNIGSNDNNLVYKTSVYNNTAGSLTIYVVTQTRFITGVGAF